MHQKTKADLTAERLREVLNYDADTGIFTWKLRVARCVKIGSVAGNPHPTRGYILISLGGKQYLAHRLAWLYSYGEMPEITDHINGDRGDNRLSNLRSVTAQQNAMNKGKFRRQTTSKWKGVSRTESGKWIALITKSQDGARITKHVGTFEDEREAAEEWMFAAIELHGEFARLG